MSYRLAHLAPTIAALALALLATLAFASPAASQETGVTEVKFTSSTDISGGSVTLRVAGEVCVTHEFTEDDPLPVVLVGASGQPAVCSQADEYIRLYDADDRLLGVKLRTAPGERVEFHNWIPWPGYTEPGVVIAADRPISAGLMVIGNGSPCAVIRFGPEKRQEVDIGRCGRNGDELRFITAEGRYLERRAASRYDHPIILRNAATTPLEVEAPPAEQLDLLDGLLACIDRFEFEDYVAVLVDRDGRVPACNLPPLASTMLRFTVADARLIPGAVIVLANQTPCVLLGVSEVGVHDVVIGEEGQPAACSRAGVELSFIDGRGRSLALRFPLRDGAVEVVGNWAPDPPHEEPERGRPNFDTYLGNITRCYRLFEGGVEERILLIADRGGKFPPCPTEYRENLRQTEATPAPTPVQATVFTTPSITTADAVAAGEATATATTAATRNVAASVVAAIVVAGLVVLGVEARARRQGGREAR